MDSLRRLVWNDTEGRPRAPWRLGLGVAVTVGVGLVGVLAASLFGALTGAALPGESAALLDTVARTLPYLAFAGGVLAAARLVDRRALADLGLRRTREWWADLTFGLALGAALPGLLVAVGLALGTLRVTGTLVARADPTLAVGAAVPPALALALTCVYFVGVAAFEEVLFRGYLLVNVAEGLNGWAGIGRRGAVGAAVALTSVAFGVTHGLNPSATSLALVNISLFGGLFAASVLLTGRVAIAVGVHVTWNVAVSSVFGFPVSGFTTPVTVLAVEQTGPALLTGGAFGPEGGLVLLVALAAGAVALAAWVRRREGRLAVDWSVARPTLRRVERPPEETAAAD